MSQVSTASSAGIESLQHFLGGVSPETSAFIGIITLFALYFHLRYSNRIAHNAPALLTTIGILGTFVGIALGLMTFDVNDVQKSVPSLIDGIKTAVWASAWGIFCALTIKIRLILSSGTESSSDSGTTATIDDLADLLTSIEQAIVGKDHADILSQLQLMRKETSEQLQAINHSLESFAGKMIEGTSQETIVSLQDIVREFNTKINAQFGGNFKQLADSIKTANEEQKSVMLGAIYRYNEEFDTHVKKTIDDARLQIKALQVEFREDYAKLVEASGKEFTALSQSLARMIRQLHNDAMLSVK